MGADPNAALVALVVVLSLRAPAAQLFVAPDGQDTNSGAKGSPFATLERARDAIRKLKRQAGGLPRGGVTVWIRGGTYRLDRSLELTAEDSGTEDAPIVYRGVPGEPVRLVGGLVVPPGSVKPVAQRGALKRLQPAARRNVLQVDLQALGLTDVGDPWPPAFCGYAGWPELFFDGRPMTLARWPNEGFARVAQVLDSGSKPRWGEKPDRPGRFRYDGDRPARWLGADEVYLNGYWCFKWYNECIRVAEIDPKEKGITFAAPHVYGVGGPSGGEYYAFNLLEELDAPGEYYVDRAHGMLYLWPPAPPAGKEVALSLLEAPMVTMTDTAHVTLRGLTFECSRGMAVTVDGGHDNLIAGCTVSNIATDALRISGGTNNGVVACDMHDMGAGGVSLSGGDRATLTPCGNYAENNHIHHYGRLFRTHRDAITLGGVGCRASHNLIHDAPHHAMDFSGNDHLVEFNEIHHVCTDSDDAGAIYTGRDWTVRGNVIRHNFFHHIGGGPAVGNQAIYLDDTACGTTCFGNVIAEVYRAFLIGGGRDNIVENNVIFGCAISVHVDNRGIGIVNSQDEDYHTLTGRLAQVPYREEPWRSRYPTLANILEDDPGYPKGNIVRRNLIVRCGGMNLATEARELGTFEDNWETEEDPGFVDARHLDLALKDDAVAFERVAALEAIPFEQIGLRKDRYRRLVRPGEPWIEPELRVMFDELQVTLASRSHDAVIRYTLDGGEPTPQSTAYAGPITLTRTTTLKAAAYAPEGGQAARSETVTATFTEARLGPANGVCLSDLTPIEAFVHGGLKRDRAYDRPVIALRGRQFAKGLSTHPETTPEGGRAHVTYALTGGLAKAKWFRAWIGVDDSAGNEGSVTFAVELRRNGEWQRVFASDVLRGGRGEPVEVDVDIRGADQLRLSVTDAGDNIHSDHAVWGDAIIQ